MPTFPGSEEAESDGIGGDGEELPGGGGDDMNETTTIEYNTLSTHVCKNITGCNDFIREAIGFTLCWIDVEWDCFGEPGRCRNSWASEIDIRANESQSHGEMIRTKKQKRMELRSYKGE